MTTSAFGVELVSKDWSSFDEKRKSVAAAGKRPTTKNTRRENTEVGAAVGGGLYGTVGAAGGGAVGRGQAKRGVATLKSIGADPGKARSARIVAGHAARKAGKVGAIAGAVGATYGAAIGAASPAKKKQKKAAVSKSAFGVELG